MENCPIYLNEIPTYAHLDIIPQGSYDALISMDWLDVHRSNFDCYEKVLECINHGLNVISKNIYGRKISSLQLNK